MNSGSSHLSLYSLRVTLKHRRNVQLGGRGRRLTSLCVLDPLLLLVQDA